MRGIVKSIRGFGLAALVASAPAAAQVTLNASSWVPPGHPITATMLAPLCADIEKATAARVKCNILPKAPVGAVQTFDGVKDGLKIRVGGGLVNEITRNLGAVPMLKPAPESYELLSTGVADGLFFPKESPLSFKLVPLIKHVTYVPGGLYNVSFAWIANQAKWNQIPEGDRRAMQPLLGEALARRSGRAWDAADAKGEAAVREAKIPIVMASAQFRAEIKAKTEPLEKEWIEKKAKPKGVDGAAVLKALRAEIAVLQKK